jgi:hypothetical protein
MKKLELIFNLLLSIVLSKFKYGQDTPVMAGLDAIVKQDGKIVAYATGVTFDEDFELQGRLCLV